MFSHLSSTYVGKGVIDIYANALSIYHYACESCDYLK